MSTLSDVVDLQMQALSLTRGNSLILNKVREQCLQLIQEYRAGTRNKVSTIIGITSCLPHNPNSPAIAMYIQMLDSYNRICEGRIARASRTNPMVEGNDEGQDETGSDSGQVLESGETLSVTAGKNKWSIEDETEQDKQ